MALNTSSKTRFTVGSPRATSLGTATRGQLRSMSSKCCLERYARITCRAASAAAKSTLTPCQREAGGSPNERAIASA